MMLAALAVILAVSQPASHLSLSPWTGKNLPTVTSSAVKYRLDVTGKPNASLHISTSQVATGWIAAFCTPTVCAPGSVDVTLPASGKAMYSFELIRNDDSAPKKSGALITTDDGASLRVSP